MYCIDFVELRDINDIENEPGWLRILNKYQLNVIQDH